LEFIPGYKARWDYIRGQQLDKMQHGGTKF